jgi:predicted DNA-binding transcriptional regulator AlpA
MNTSITDLQQLKVLNFEQARQFLGYSKSTMYQKTCAGILPFSKPNSGRLYFDREKLEAWMLGNPSTSLQEKQIEAATYLSTRK